MGVVGTGKIGQAVCRILAGFFTTEALAAIAETTLSSVTELGPGRALSHQVLAGVS